MPTPVLIRSLVELPPSLRGGAVAIGNFDGVHRGHKVVIEAARPPAGRDAARLALTFEPHPRSYFSGQPLFRLSPEREKAVLLVRAGIDATVSLPFDEILSRQSAEAFVRETIVEGLGAVHVAIGFDFRFGADRAGDAALLEAMGARYGFGVTVVPAQSDAVGPISSSRIRDALGAGDIATANALLGHPWLVSGEVIRGKQLGRTLGYPTANLALPPETDLAHGIYAVRAKLDGRPHDGVASFGRRPTFDNGAVLLETFLFDFAGDLYGKRLEIAFHAFLRGEAKFDGAEALVAQMDEDSRAAKEVLAKVRTIDLGPDLGDA